MAPVDADEGDAVRELRQRLAEPRPVLEQLGQAVAESARRAFSSGGLPGAAWPSVMVPNVPGVVSDLNAGMPPRPARFLAGARPLVGSGRLAESISVQATGDQVDVEARADYAALHQEGGQAQVALDATGQRTLRSWWGRLSRSRKRELRGEIAWLFRRPSFLVDVQPRPFLAAPEAAATTESLLVEGVGRG